MLFLQADASRKGTKGGKGKQDPRLRVRTSARGAGAKRQAMLQPLMLLPTSRTWPIDLAKKKNKAKDTREMPEKHDKAFTACL